MVPNIPAPAPAPPRPRHANRRHVVVSVYLGLIKAAAAAACVSVTVCPLPRHSSRLKRAADCFYVAPPKVQNVCVPTVPTGQCPGSRSGHVFVVHGFSWSSLHSALFLFCRVPESYTFPCPISIVILLCLSRTSSCRNTRPKMALQNHSQHTN